MEAMKDEGWMDMIDSVWCLMGWMDFGSFCFVRSSVVVSWIFWAWTAWTQIKSNNNRTPFVMTIDSCCHLCPKHSNHKNFTNLVFKEKELLEKLTSQAHQDGGKEFTTTTASFIPHTYCVPLIPLLIASYGISVDRSIRLHCNFSNRCLSKGFKT